MYKWMQHPDARDELMIPGNVSQSAAVNGTPSRLAVEKQPETPQSEGDSKPLSSRQITEYRGNGDTNDTVKKMDTLGQDLKAKREHQESPQQTSTDVDICD